MIIKLKGVVKDYVWGGKKLIEEFNQESSSEIAAESWVLSTHPDGPSIILDENIKEKTLDEYIFNYPDSLGRKLENQSSLPIMIKLINSAQPLSVQVHPEDDYAKIFENDNGKNEMWFILDSEEDSKLIVGLKEEVSKEELKKLIKDDSIVKSLNEISVKKGDFVYIPAGTIHAIGPNLTICEIQQSSNVTYRLYDYNRKDHLNRTRELHIDKAIDVSITNMHTNQIGRPLEEFLGKELQIKKLVSNEYFTTHTVTFDEGVELLHSKDSFCGIIVLEGSAAASINGCLKEITKGDSLFVPAQDGYINLVGSAKILTVRV